GEIQLKKKDGTVFWADLHACPAFSSDLFQKVCRISLADITALKDAAEARRHVEILTHFNEKLQREIVRRQAVEEALRKSERHQTELLERARELQEKLRELSHLNLHTMEKERKRISRDLHDDVVQSLVGINFDLESLVVIPGITPEALKEKIAQTQQLVEESVQSILTFAHALRPPGLDDLGLVVSLNTLLADFTRRTDMEVHFVPIDEMDQLSGDQRIALYRIVQTALANVEEHSQATRVELRITQTADTLQIEVTDNGISFDVPGQEALRRGQHLGLISMRERTEMMGGTFEIESTPGKGTRLVIQIPLTDGKEGGVEI
ncbi:MAG: sensor histidine kinase, partial [Kiritimatiellia bacterium]